MLSWSEASRQAAIEAANVHGELGVSLDEPVDVYAAIEQLGIVLAFAPMDRCSGVYVPSTSPGALPGILIHQGHPRSRQRFTAAHELGHHVFGHEFEIDTDLGEPLLRTTVSSMTDQERQAEAFASWFLMPRRLLRAGVRRLGLALDNPAEVYALSLWLGTSYFATVTQLLNTRMLSDSRAAELGAVRPRDIKVGLVGHNQVDLKNDIWWVDDTTLSNPIDVRAGDSLIVRLRENATTGFSWEPDGLSSEFLLRSDSFEEEWEPSRGAPVASADEEPAGQEKVRSLLISVPADVPETVLQLGFKLVQPWSDEERVAGYQILVSVSRPAFGLQLDPQALAV